MYKILSDGYTVNRKIDSTAKPYISISYQKDSLSKGTRFFTASTLAVMYQLNIVQLAYLFLSTKISAAPQGFPRIKKVKKHTHFYLLSRK